PEPSLNGAEQRLKPCSGRHTEPEKVNDWAIYNINGDRFAAVFKRFTGIHVTILGDLTCSTIIYAMRSEREPERFGYGVVLETDSRKQWIVRNPGSAGLIATTARSTGAMVKLISIIGDDTTGNFLRGYLKRAKVSPVLFLDPTRM